MVRIRHGWLVVVLALAFVAACKKDDTAADKAGGKSGSAGTGADLSLLPMDSEVVVGIHVSQLQQSGVWKQFVEPKLKTGETLRKMDEFKAKCGVDPMSAVKSISLGMKGFADGKPNGVVVVHGMEKSKAMSCFDQMKDEMAKDGTEFSRDGDTVLFKNTRTGGQVAMAYINDTTALAVFGEQANAASVKALQSGGQTLKGSQAFLDMYGKINAGDSLWFLLSGQVLEKARLPVKAKAVFGSINMTDGLSLDARMRLESADAAAQFATGLKGQVQGAATMVDKIDIAPEGDQLKISVVISNQKLKSLIAQFGGMLGMLGGMGGP